MILCLKQVTDTDNHGEINMNTKIMAIIVVAILGVSAVGAFVILSDDNDGYDISLARGLAATHEPVWIADAKGFFDEEGVKVNLVSVSGGGDGMTALLSGGVDMAVSGADTMVRMIDNSDTAMIVGMLECSYRGGYQPFAVMKGYGIQLNDASSFFTEATGTTVKSGVQLGIDTSTAYYSNWIFYLKDEMAAGHINQAQYDILVKVDSGSGGFVKHFSKDQLVTAFASGNVKVIFTDNVPTAVDTVNAASPDAAEQQNAPLQPTPVFLTATGDALEHKSDAIAKVLRALDKACAFMRNSETKDEAIQLCVGFRNIETWGVSSQTVVFNSFRWDVCMLYDGENYLQTLAAVLDEAYETIDYSDLVVAGRVNYTFLVEMHSDANFMWDYYSMSYKAYVPA